LRVRDNGAGPSERPFCRAPETMRRSPAGNSLNLPVAKSLAEASGACLRMMSAPEAGTLIELSFPKERVVTTSAPNPKFAR